MKIFSVLISFALFLNGFCAFGQGVRTEGVEYYVSPGDIISVNVFPATEFSRDLTVQPDGSVELPLLGSIKVEGYTSEEIKKVLTSRFSKYVADPEISVSVRKFASSRLGIIGEVKTPGYYPFVEGMSVLDLITQARGFNDYAKLEKSQIFRKIKDSKGNIREEVIYVDMEKVVAGDFRYNMKLASGDIVYVPRKKFSKFTRWMSDNIVPWLTIATLGLVLEDRINR